MTRIDMPGQGSWMFEGRQYIEDPRTRPWTDEERATIRSRMAGNCEAAINAVIYNWKIYRPIPASDIVWC